MEVAALERDEFEIRMHDQLTQLGCRVFTRVAGVGKTEEPVDHGRVNASPANQLYTALR